MSDETRAFPVGLALTLVTGKGFGSTLSEVHAAIEFVLGHGVWTHELAMHGTWERVREVVLIQHPELKSAEFTATGDEDAARRFVAEWEQWFGREVELLKGSDVRTCDPLSTLAEVAPGKPVIVVEVS